MEPLQNIWNKNKPINNEDLKAYVQNELTTQEQYHLESEFNEMDAFEQDAIDGLKQTIPKSLDVTLLELNKKIEKTLLQKKQKRKIINTTSTNTIAIITLLGLIIIGYIIIRMVLKKP